MRISTVFKHRLFWPVLALAALVAINTISRPSFLSVSIQNGAFYGSIIDILRNSSQLMLVALGMMLVIATRGIDLSVGAVLSVSGAVALTYIAASPDPAAPATIAIGIALALVVTLVLGTWNGFLVSVVGIQPIIATLVLMLAGRGIAMLITQGQITTISSAPYAYLASGNLFGFPFAFVIALAAIVILSLLVRRTALGVLIEAVGINPQASRLAGVRSRGLTWTVYALSGLLSGMAGILASSNIMAADANNAGVNIEVDAILAVVIGGTSLLGGTFSIAGTVIGVLIIQTLTATITFIGIAPSRTPVFKALVIVAICLAQSPKTRELLFRRRAVKHTPTAAPASTSTSTAETTTPQAVTR